MGWQCNQKDPLTLSIIKNTADGTAGQYAGVMNWENVTLDETTTLSLTVEGQLGADNYGGSHYTTAAINAMIITMVPEPATATLSLLALCGLAARRRRS